MKTYVGLLLLLVLQVSATFKICAFNIKSFGEAKASNKKIMGMLTKILSRCDISVIQEVRDSKGEAVPALVTKLNKFDAAHRYQHLESKRLGKNSYKEQYVFIYREDTVKVMDWYQYVEDHPEHPEAFAREPFAVRFHSPTTVVKEFALMSHHTCPSKAATEINRLLQVMLQVKSRWKIQSLMLLGDLNAACGYVTAEEWRNIQRRSGDTFHWLIGDKDDTTVNEKTHCAYDRPVTMTRGHSLRLEERRFHRHHRQRFFTVRAVRLWNSLKIVVHGEELLKGIVPGSAKPFNFKKKLGLSEEEALEVSDHYPVEVNLRADPRMDREL